MMLLFKLFALAFSTPPSSQPWQRSALPMLGCLRGATLQKTTHASILLWQAGSASICAGPRVCAILCLCCGIKPGGEWETFSDRAVAPVLGPLSPTEQPIKGAGEGAETGVQHTPCPGGQTPALQRGERAIWRCSGLCTHALNSLKAHAPEESWNLVTEC